MNAEYSEIVGYLTEEQGFHHYEVSNFGKPGFESQHNRAYWTHENVRGFGLSAASLVSGRRFENAASFAAYYRGEIVQEEVLNVQDIALESAMFGLRTSSLGVNTVENQTQLRSFLDQGLLERRNEIIRPTLA